MPGSDTRAAVGSSSVIVSSPTQKPKKGSWFSLAALGRGEGGVPAARLGATGSLWSAPKVNRGRSFMRRGIENPFVVVGFILALVCVGHAAAAEPFKLTSPAYDDNAVLAAKNAGDNKSNPNCVGDNVSPPL